MALSTRPPAAALAGGGRNVPPGGAPPSVSQPLARSSVLPLVGTAQESDECGGFRNIGELFHHAVERLGAQALAAEDLPASDLERLDRIRGEASTLQSDGIDAAHPRRTPLDEQKGRNILGHAREPSHKGSTSDADEMVHGSQTTQAGPGFDLDVPAEKNAVGDDDMILDEAIVSHVTLRHEQAVTADLSEPSPQSGPAVDGSALADLVTIPDDHPALLAHVLAILRGRSQDGAWKDFIVLTEDRVLEQRHAVVQSAATTDLASQANDRKRADLHSRRDLRRGMQYYVGGMSVHLTPNYS
jgi:hypothetical protein